jgi:hypothetical protein
MKTYLNRLRRHPGLGYVALLTIFGVAAGAGRGNASGALVGGLIMSVFWIPVLLTARG